MEGVLIWAVVALALLIVFIVVSRPAKQRHLIAVEPLEYLITDWQLARVDEPREKIRQLITLFLNTGTEPSILDNILAAAATVPEKRLRASLISEASYETLCEQRLVEWGNNVTSILIGHIRDITNQIAVAGSSRLPFEKVRPTLEAQAKTAAEHGFIALAVAMSTVHGDSYKDPRFVNHSYVGSVLLEAKIDQSRAAKLNRHHRRTGLRFLSVLPEPLVSSVLDKINFERSLRSIDRFDVAKESLREKERLIGQADVVAHADDDLIFTALRIWSSGQSCRYLSTVKTEDLPVEIIRELP